MNRIGLAGTLALSLFFIPQAASAHEAPKKVLYVTTAAGFSHSSRHLSKVIVEDIGKRSGVWDTVYDPRATLKGPDGKDKDNTGDEQAIKHITPEGLKAFDAVFFYTTGGKDQFPLSEENRNALIEFVKSGKAFVGFHSATDTYADWPPYAEMIGGSFDGHPWHEEVKIDVEDPAHPAAVFLDRQWSITDEIYQFKNYSRADKHVILSLSLESEKGKAARADKDVAIAWCKEFGKGKVFYTSLGHREDVWTDPTFREHVLGGARWALGLAPGDATPGLARASNEWKPIFTKLEDCATSGDGKWEIGTDGTLKGTGKAGHIFTRESYRDFQLKAEVNINDDGNSGMYFRCRDQGVWPRGYEAQVNNAYKHDPVRTGSFYGRDRIFTRLVPKKEPWFTQEIIAVGNQVIIKVNGKIVVNRTDDAFREGTFALQQHHDGSIVQYKNVQVRVLPPRGEPAKPGAGG